jgi:hypothetical protein
MNTAVTTALVDAALVVETDVVVVDLEVVNWGAAVVDGTGSVVEADVEVDDRGGTDKVVGTGVGAKVVGGGVVGRRRWWCCRRRRRRRCCRRRVVVVVVVNVVEVAIAEVEHTAVVEVTHKHLAGFTEQSCDAVVSSVLASDSRARTKQL